MLSPFVPLISKGHSILIIEYFKDIKGRYWFFLLHYGRKLPIFQLFLGFFNLIWCRCNFCFFRENFWKRKKAHHRSNERIWFQRSSACCCSLDFACLNFHLRFQQPRGRVSWLQFYWLRLSWFCSWSAASWCDEIRLRNRMVLLPFWI